MQLVEKILDTFLPPKTRVATYRRAVIRSFINGGIVNGRAIHIESRCGKCGSIEQFHGRIHKDFIAALNPRAPRSFPCRGWRGCEETPDMYGLLESMGFWTGAYARWVGDAVVRACAGQEGPGHDVGNAAEHPEYPALEDGLAEEVNPEQMGQGAAAAGGIPAGEQQQGDHVKYQKLAYKFTKSKPLSQVTVTRKVMGLFQPYVDGMLYFTSKRFRRKQDWTTINGIGSSSASSSSAPKVPDYPALLAYEGKLESQFLEEARKLLGPDAWGLVAQADRTSELRCKAFRSISCAMCMTGEGLYICVWPGALARGPRPEARGPGPEPGAWARGPGVSRERHY